MITNGQKILGVIYRTGFNNETEKDHPNIEVPLEGLIIFGYQVDGREVQISTSGGNFIFSCYGSYPNSSGLNEAIIGEKILSAEFKIITYTNFYGGKADICVCEITTALGSISLSFQNDEEFSNSVSVYV